MRKYLCLILLCLLLFSGLANSVWIFTDTVILNNGYELHHKVAVEYTFVDIETNYTILDGHNITYVNNVTSQHSLIERDGYFNLGNYTTNLFFNLYAPSDWIINMLNIRLKNNNVTHENLSIPVMSYTWVDAGHTIRNYSKTYNPTSIYFKQHFPIGWTSGVKFPQWAINNSASDSVEDVFSSVTGVEWVWNLVPLLSWQRGRDPAFNTLTTINSTAEYYIFADADCTLSILGNHNATIHYDVDVFARCSNSTLYYFGNRTWDDMFTVYVLDPPYNGSSTWDAGSKHVNITWDSGNNSDTDVVVRKNGTSNPTTPFDGYVVYNGTLGWFNESATTNRAYTVFSYNTTSHSWSEGLNIYWGALGVSVFNQSIPTEAVTNWNISIKNAEGTEWYASPNQNNIFYLDFILIPHGINCQIKIWKNGWDFGIQTVDLSDNQFKNISFYLSRNILPPGEPGGGSGGIPGQNFTPLIYTVRVVETVVSPYTQVDRGVKGALVLFQRYNSTVGLFNVSSMLTDDNGYCSPNPYLVPSVTYQVVITKDGYTTITTDYTPLPADLYGRTEEKVFRIEKSEQEYEQYIYKNITVSITPDSREHSTNFTLYYNISSSDNKLEYFGMIISYINDSMSDWSEVYNVTTVTVSGGSLSYHVNKSGSYSVICFFKRQGFDVFYFGEPHSLYKMIYTLLNAPQIDILDEKITKVLGKSPVYVGAYIASYTAIIVGVVATLLLFSFNPRLAGLGVTGTGLTLGFMKYGFHIIPDQVMTVVQIALICILGVMLMIVLKKRS